MDILAFERRAKELKLAEQLWGIRTARLAGAKGHTIAEVRDVLQKTIAEMAFTGRCYHPSVTLSCMR